MLYIGTYEECKAYNNEVIEKENYDGINTTDWCKPIECIGYWAVIANDKYPSSLTIVDSINIKINDN